MRENKTRDVIRRKVVAVPKKKRKARAPKTLPIVATPQWGNWLKRAFQRSTPGEWLPAQWQFLMENKKFRLRRKVTLH